MTSTRLTKTIREQILDAVMKHGFDARKEAMKEMHFKLGEAIYNDLFPAKVREQMAALPKGFLHTSESVLVAFSGEVYRASFREHKPISYLRRDWEAMKAYDCTHTLSKQHDKVIAAQKALNKERDEAKSMAESLLNSAYSTKQLIAAWPEVEQFVRPYIDAAPCTALAIPVQKLNKALSLPPKAVK